MERINKDELKVWCTGDLIDGCFNREGDLMCLAYAPKWFDGICVGNHEYSFMGGIDFGGMRSHDRELQLGLLRLEAAGVYRPTFLVDNYLLVHGGLHPYWGYHSEKQANEAIEYLWEDAKLEISDVEIFDNIGGVRGSSKKWQAGGIFWNDWDELRSKRINQIVGHSTRFNGPIREDFPDYGSTHWNIDVGGKTGDCLGGVYIENCNTTPVKMGNYTPPKNPRVILLDQIEENDLEAQWRELMETTD